MFKQEIQNSDTKNLDLSLSSLEYSPQLIFSQNAIAANNSSEKIKNSTDASSLQQSPGPSFICKDESVTAHSSLSDAFTEKDSSLILNYEMFSPSCFKSTNISDFKPRIISSLDDQDARLSFDQEITREQKFKSIN